MLRPEQTKTDFPHHEKCDFPKFHSAIEANGVWNVVSGIKGKTQEISFEVNVEADGMWFFFLEQISF